MTPLAIEPLQSFDAAAMAQLERRVVAFPWSEQQYRESLAAGVLGWELLRGRDGVGFCLFQKVLDEATLLNIVLAPEVSGAGHGTRLLAHALAELAARGVVQCWLEVRVSNRPALAVYRKLGFVEMARRRDYYPAASGKEDALVMCRKLPEGLGETV